MQTDYEEPPLADADAPAAPGKSRSLVANPFGEGQLPSAQTAGLRQSQARELAEMQTKFVMAQQFPRDERKAMDGIINAFSRPGLAERAQYQYSRGGTDITGPSVHTAQAIAQQWGNIEMGWREASRGIGYDGVPYSEVETYAWDLQSRVPSRIGFIVRHWRDTKSGGYKLKDERDIYELCASQAQRRKRACILAILPQDVVDVAMEQATATLATKADTSPEAMQKMLEAFRQFGVTKEQIEKLIQRRLDSIVPAQVMRLKRIYTSLRDEMSTPDEWFEPAEPAQGQQGAAATQSSADKAKDALKQRAAKKAEAAPHKPAAKTLAQYVEQIDNAADLETAQHIFAEAKDALTPSEAEQLQASFDAAWKD